MKIIAVLVLSFLPLPLLVGVEGDLCLFTTLPAQEEMGHPVVVEGVVVVQITIQALQTEPEDRVIPLL